MPANDAALPNIANEQLATLRNLSVNDAQLKASYARGLAWVDQTHGTVTRSPKGGLLGKPTHGASFQPTAYQVIRLPQAVLDHIVANQSRAYYVSMWHKVLLPEGANFPIYGFIGHEGSALGPRLMGWQVGDRPSGNSAASLGSSLDPIATPGTKFRNIAVQGITHSTPDAASQLVALNTRGQFGWGNMSQGVSYNSTIHGAHYAIYRLYVEDLTASGRSYAQVSALDKTLYAKEVLTPGGRYYNDNLA